MAISVQNIYIWLTLFIKRIIKVSLYGLDSDKIKRHKEKADIGRNVRKFLKVRKPLSTLPETLSKPITSLTMLAKLLIFSTFEASMLERFIQIKDVRRPAAANLAAHSTSDNLGIYTFLGSDQFDLISSKITISAGVTKLVTMSIQLH